MSEPTLLVQNVSKRYVRYRSEIQRFSGWLGLTCRPQRESWSLRDVSFSLDPGRAIGVLGANGAGKSSLLKIVAGALMPTSGTVATKGQTAAVLELGITFDPELTGAENVRLYAHLLGYSPTQIRELEPEIRSFAEIGDAFDQPLRTYSTGMQARLAFSVVTARRPDLLIIDEVLSVGDGYFQAKSFNRIRGFLESGTSIMYVSHGLDGIEAICDQALWLQQGQVRMLGPVHRVCQAYREAIADGQISAVNP